MNPSPRPHRTGRKQLTALRTWIARRRRAALTHLLRGACYGAGTSAASLIVLWAQNHL